MFDVTQVNVSDIYVMDHGYSMVLPTFYICRGISKTGKTLKFQRIGHTFTPSDPPYNQQGFRTPDETRTEGDVFNVRVNPKRDYLTYKGRLLRKWDGRPEWYDSMD